MEIKKQFVSFVIGLFTLPFAQAGWVGMNGNKTPLTLQAFDGMNRFMRNYAIADLLTGGQDSPDKNQILQRYLHQAPREEQAEIYEVAFNTAFNVRKKDLAQDFFEKGSRLNPEFSQNALCSALNNLVSATNFHQSNDLQELSKHHSQIELLMPLVQSNPNAANQFCQIGMENPKSVTIRDIVSAASPSFGDRLNPHYRPPTPVRTVAPARQHISLHESSCTAAQTRSYLAAKLQEVQQSGDSAFLEPEGDNCVINGILKKTKNGYTMIKNPRTSLERILDFRDLSELVTLFQATEKPPKPKTAAKDSQSQPASEDPNQSAGGAWANPLSNSSIRYSQ